MKVQLPKESIYLVAYYEEWEKNYHPYIIAAFKTKSGAERFIKQCQKYSDIAEQNGENFTLIGANNNNKFVLGGFQPAENLHLIESETNDIEIPFFNK